MKEIYEKIKSVVICHAVADALGVPVEFRGRTELAKAPVTDMRGFGTYSVPAGSWSDDTSMSLAALDSLANGRLDYTEIGTFQPITRPQVRFSTSAVLVLMQYIIIPTTRESRLQNAAPTAITQTETVSL